MLSNRKLEFRINSMNYFFVAQVCYLTRVIMSVSSSKCFGKHLFLITVFFLQHKLRNQTKKSIYKI
jgi:hypothetical protein